MEVKAVARYVRISPMKVRMLADAIKGRPVDKALDTLKFMP
jgi:large subunit ribosomal protein L22